MGRGSGARARARALACVAVLGMVLASGVDARADNPKVNVDSFRPSVHPGDLLGVLTSSQAEMLDFGAGAWLTLNSRPLRLDVQKPFDWVAWQLVADVYGWFNLFGVVDIGVDLPISLFNHGDAPTVVSDRIGQVGGVSLGDLRLSVKGTLLGGNGRGFGLALAEDLTFPTATGQNFTGDELVTSTTTLILDYSAHGWMVALNGGFRAKKSVDLFTKESGHQILLGFGVAAPILCGTLDAIATAEARTGISHAFASASDTALDLMGGLRATVANVNAVVAAGAGTLSDVGSPNYRVTVSLGYSPSIDRGCRVDSDGDGVLDPDDDCPDLPGPAATRGCPDRDGDGVADREDRCPDEPGPPDLGGCPDRDGDGIVDSQDACPDKPGLLKWNGCPDSDGDGIPDNLDRCPDEAGPAQTSGCPDRDGDGVPDRDDRCPDAWGPPRNQGCPLETSDRIKITTARVEISETVQFEAGRAKIRDQSFGLLTEVAKALVDNPQITKVRVEGHTDSVGDPKKNLELSQKRAEAVRDFLVAAGVAADRLEAVGYGDTRPVAAGRTKEAQAANRRVEFSILGR